MSSSNLPREVLGSLYTMSQMTPQQAIQCLIKAAQLGQTKGIWSLDDAYNLKIAIDIATTLKFVNPKDVDAVKKSTTDAQKKVELKTERISPVKKVVKPSPQKLPTVVEETVKKSDVSEVKKDPFATAKMAKMSKISQNLKLLQENIKKNHVPSQIKKPRILGLDGPIGQEVSLPVEVAS